jgi:predicted signal transduction protein with EAL and GGDEF domain
MTVATRLPRTFESSDLEFVAAVADQIAVALDRARQHTREARTDYLTGLANRPEFERAIDRAVAAAQRHKRRLTLMMIDLDTLKAINDTEATTSATKPSECSQEMQRGRSEPPTPAAALAASGSACHARCR